jgi:transposase InsO family protein
VNCRSSCGHPRRVRELKNDIADAMGRRPTQISTTGTGNPRMAAFCSMSRSGNVWTAAMESFFSSLKTERTARKIYRTRNEARADVFDYIERFYNATRRHSTIGYLSPVEFERKVGLA